MEDRVFFFLVETLHKYCVYSHVSLILTNTDATWKSNHGYFYRQKTSLSCMRNPSSVAR